MYIKNQEIKTFYRIIFILICLLGIVLQYSILDTEKNILMLGCYYTIQSNIVCFLYFSYLLIMQPKKENSMIKGMVVLCITITGLVYHFMLNGAMENNIEALENISKTYILANTFVHYIVPIMVIFDYLLFSQKGNYKWYYPFTWLALPLAYLVFIFIRAEVSNNLFKGFNGESRFPYPFVDVDMFGITKVAIMISVMIIGILALGFISYGVDKLLKLIYKKIKQKHFPNKA